MKLEIQQCLLHNGALICKCGWTVSVKTVRNIDAVYDAMKNIYLHMTSFYAFLFDMFC